MTKGIFVVGYLIFGFVASNVQAHGRTPPKVTNVWSKASGGNWSDRSAWSEGRPPAWTHWVAITNETPKVIEINASTVQSFPDSLTMAHLVIGTNNTLLLNHVGARLQLDDGTNLWNGVILERGGALRNLGSDIRVDGVISVEAYSEFAQDGGVVEARMGSVAGAYYLTNGVFSGRYLNIYGSFDQFAGQVFATDGFKAMFSAVRVHGGGITTPSITVQDYGAIQQKAGVVRASAVTIGVSGSAAYLLDGGELYAENVAVAPFMSAVSFEQDGGVAVITNTLHLRGSARYYPPQPTYAEYFGNSNAVFSAGSIWFDQQWGSCWFETAGQASISGNIEFKGDPMYRGTLAILGGSAVCSNVLSDGAYVNISQEGGSFIVRRLLMIAGYFPGVYGGFNARPARYDFKAGTLTAPVIELTAEWSIGSSTQPGRITNSEEFRLGGALVVGDAAEQFGRLILIDDSSINMGQGNAKLTFAASSGEPWNDQATLFITEWNGSLGGGGPDRVIVRGGAAGLTAQQLQQIRFANPAGFRAGQYFARILGSGEIVPSDTREISIQASGGDLVVNWSDGRVLQGSHDVEGPYVDVATQPPYSANVNAYARLFLRPRP